jgi:hypothetical protein
METGDGTVYIRIYQLMLTHGAEVAPSYYKSEKCGAEGQSLVPLLATAFYSIILNFGTSGAPGLNNR